MGATSRGSPRACGHPPGFTHADQPRGRFSAWPASLSRTTDVTGIGGPGAARRAPPSPVGHAAILRGGLRRSPLVPAEHPRLSALAPQTSPARLWSRRTSGRECRGGAFFSHLILGEHACLSIIWDAAAQRRGFTSLPSHGVLTCFVSEITARRSRNQKGAMLCCSTEAWASNEFSRVVESLRAFSPGAPPLNPAP